MSRHDYLVSMQLDGQDHPFYALIMAAMRKADTDNQIKLAFAWPEVWQELQDRYNSPGGYLPGEYVKIGEQPSRRHADCMPGDGCLLAEDDECPFQKEN